ncbi:hypothetical protein D3C71_1832600 [compost metagenome]
MVSFAAPFLAGAFFAADLADFAAAAGFSTETAPAGLSVRRPWNTACRTRPSLVQAPKDTSATSFGLTQWPRMPRGRSSNGGASVTSGSSCLRSVPSIAVSKPVPTLPA